MNPVPLLMAAPLVVLPFLPLVPRAGRSWLAFLAGLLPLSALFPAGAATLPWVMLGAGTAQNLPGAPVLALLAPLFAAALWPPRCHLAMGTRACLLLGQGALGAALLASDLLLLLAGFTLATYALLAARLGAGATAPGQLRAAIVLLVLGDLAAFELALLLAKAAAHAVVPAVTAAPEAVAGSSFIAAFAMLAGGSRGALLLLAGGRSGTGPVLAVFVLLAVPALGWRVGGSGAVPATAAAVATFALLAAGLGRLLSHGLPAQLTRIVPGEGMALPGRRGEAHAVENRGSGRGELSRRLGALELVLGSWTVALGASVVLVLLLLAATLR